MQLTSARHGNLIEVYFEAVMKTGLASPIPLLKPLFVLALKRYARQCPSLGVVVAVTVYGEGEIQSAWYHADAGIA